MAREKTRARQSAATVKKLRAEQAEASIDALSKAKTIYAARGDVNSCGDWLAMALKDAFRTDDGSFDVAAFKVCLKENSLTPPNVDMDRHGANRSVSHMRGFDATSARGKGWLCVDRKQENHGTQSEEARTESENGQRGSVF